MSYIKRIMVPTDFSTAAGPAIGYAIDLAKRYEGSLLLVHVIEDTYFAHAYPDGYFADLPQLQQQLRQDAERRLKELSERCAASGVTVTRQVLEGRPARVSRV